MSVLALAPSMKFLRHRMRLSRKPHHQLLSLRIFLQAFLGTMQTIISVLMARTVATFLRIGLQQRFMQHLAEDLPWITCLAGTLSPFWNSKD
ncbi:hypothetical protein Goari_019720 [Gossypium aridum]|uniref:Uncharacterized protein n=1 Tax=Gossypium aridum TaxID=34290 RepID=A0A7J8WTH3_GOSAI|nr:hypothetical protein [Gossypium aridum]